MSGLNEEDVLMLTFLRRGLAVVMVEDGPHISAVDPVPRESFLPPLY